MLHLIDLDTEYQMKEHEEVSELSGKNTLVCGEYRTDKSEGIFLNQNITSPSQWLTEIKDFLKKNKTKCVDFLGFPNDWEKDSFWA